MNVSPIRNAIREAPEVLSKARPWVEPVARLGYAAKGVVFGTIALMALQLALGQGGGGTKDAKGAIRIIAEQPFGMVLLAVLGVGLFAHAVWRFVQAFFDTENRGKDLKGIAQRIGYALTGVLYTSLGLVALRLLLGSGGRSGHGGPRQMTATLLSAPMGQLLVGLVAAIVIAVGAIQFVKAWKEKFLEKLDLSRLPARLRGWVSPLGRFGLSARGVVFILLGVFLAFAAIDANPREARGFGEILGFVAAQPYGKILLSLVAFGLLAYATFLFVKSRCQRINVPR